MIETPSCPGQQAAQEGGGGTPMVKILLDKKSKLTYNEHND